MKKEKLAVILKIIGEKNRMDILCLLFRHEKICVSQIADQLELSVATTSHHLKTLEEIELVTSIRDGREICYSISDIKIMNDIKTLICNNLKFK